MSYNGSGTFLINSAGQPVVANTVISATVFNALTSDLATGLSTAITKDGQTTITNNIPFGSNKITGLGSGTAAADAANLGQVQSTVAKLITVTGTDTITGSMSPQLTAYAAGQLFYFVANAANTGAVTLNIDSLGAKSITRDGSSALAAGDINSGEVVVVIYDGTRFQMINAANSFGNTTINGTLTVTGNAGFQANVSITSALSVGGVFAVTGAATFTANPTLSAGTANGVLYLNGSKVATSGSALVFDGTNLGLGVTPSAWASSRALQVGNASVFAISNVGFLGANAYYDGSYKYIAGGTAQVLEVNNGNEFRFLTATSGSAGGTISFTQAMTLNASGNLLVGTTTASGRLTVNASTSADSRFVLQLSGTPYCYFGGYSGITGSGNADDVALFAWTGKQLMFGTNGTERARITAGGALAVGLTTPTFADGNGIHLNNSSGAARFHVTNNTTGTTATDGSEFTVAGSDLYIINNESATMQFWTSAVERGRFTAGGYFKASDTGTYFGSTGAYHELRQTTNNICVIASSSDANYSSTIYYADTTRAANAAFNLASWRANNVTQFEVSGAGVIYAQNTTVQSLSDGRLKENVSDATDGLSVINALRPVRYDWKAGYGNDRKNQLGFIAQEMETVFPEAVAEWKVRDDEEAYKTVGPGALIPVLVKAMQEQQAMINELKAKVAALEA